MVNLLFDAWPGCVFEWILFAITTPFVCARLYVQFKFRNKPKREIFIIIAWFLYLFDTITDSRLVDGNWYNNGVGLDGFLNRENLVTNWLNSLCYMPALYACKAALLIFYGEVCKRRYFPKTWLALVGCWVFVGIGFGAQVVKWFFPCAPYPLAHVWDPETYIPHCYDGALSKFWVQITWSLHLWTDILVYLVPFFILHNLKTLSAKDKRAAYILFAFGAVNILTAVTLLLEYVLTSYNLSEKTAFLGFNLAQAFIFPWQLGSAIMIVCIPYVRRLVRGLRAKDLRPELNTGNMTVHHRATGAEDPEYSGADATPPKTPPKVDYQRANSQPENVAVEITDVEKGYHR